MATTAPEAIESPAAGAGRHLRFRARLAAPTAWYVWCGIIAALPLLGVLIGMAQVHWVPTSDDGTIAWRGWLVFGRHPPLTGQFTLASQGQSAYDPGPLLYWVVAAPSRIWTDLGPMVGVCLLGAASVVVAVVAAGQVGGRVIVAVVAGAALVGVWTAPHVLGDLVWNPYSAVLPFVALLLVTWAVASGRLGWWAVAVFLASYCVQAHLVYGIASVLLVIAGPVLGYVSRRRSGALLSSFGKRWWVAGLVVGMIVWGGPAWQQIKHQQGNLTSLWRSNFGGSVHHLGAAAGLRLFGWSVRVPPMWSSAARRSPFRVIATTAAGTATQVWAVAVLALLVVAATVAFRRRLHDVFGLAVVALLASGGAVLSIRGMAIDKAVTTIGYVSVIFYPVGFIVWLALGWSVWRLLLQPWLARRPVTPGRPGAALSRHRDTLATASLVLLLVASIGAAGWVSHAAPRADYHTDYQWHDLRSIDKQVLHLVQNGDVPKGRLALDLDALGTASLQVTSIGYQLLTRGWTPTVDISAISAVNDWRFANKASDPKLIVAHRGSPAPKGSRLLGVLVDPVSHRHFSVYFRPGLV